MIPGSSNLFDCAPLLFLVRKGIVDTQLKATVKRNNYSVSAADWTKSAKTKTDTESNRQQLPMPYSRSPRCFSNRRRFCLVMHPFRPAHWIHHGAIVDEKLSKSSNVNIEWHRRSCPALSISAAFPWFAPTVHFQCSTYCDCL